jgi:DNA-binding MarR family transcriptional regulator
MRTAVAGTSIAAYRSLQQHHQLQPQEQKIMDAIRHHGAATREELCDRTGLRLSAVCGRARKLVEDGLLIEQGTRTNPVSGKANKVLCLPAGQLGLFN